MSQLQILQQRGFDLFFATQFLGVFNDNLFKNALEVTPAAALNSVLPDTPIGCSENRSALPRPGPPPPDLHR